MKLQFTKILPKKPGYYWWTNFGEHTPVVLEVKRDYNDGGLWASNEEFAFKVGRAKFEKDKEMMVGGYYYGEELWCYIPNPHLPNGEQVEPDSY
jgi:hypothetical protein